MDISQSDRNKLRVAQHKLNPNFVIGNIVEHKVQDPRKYKQISRAEQGHSTIDQLIEMPKISYKTQYYRSNSGDKSPAASLPSIQEDFEPSLPIDPKDAQTNMWLNMDQVEIDKLEWMSNKAEKIHQDRIRGSTRFDHEGRAVVHDDTEKMKDETTHDINSLVNLLDSTYEPQVTYALNVVSKIATLATVGYYDGAFDENIHNILIKNCLLRVRHHLDSPNETICQSALKSLRSLLCNTRVDEVILDRVHTLYSDNYDPNIWLFTTEEAPKEFTIEMKDSECVLIDAIATLIKRTAILQRFSYLLSAKNEKYARTYADYILDILIRIVRHSRSFCLSVIKENSLIDLIISSYLPASVTTQHKKIRHLSVKALKLVRIISQAGSELELRNQVNSHNVIANNIPEAFIKVAAAYFFIDVNNLHLGEREQLFKLHIEALRIVKILAKMRKFREQIKSILAMGQEKHVTSIKALACMDATKPMEPTISLDWQYAAHLIDATGYFVKKDSYTITMNFDSALWDGYITPILCQWLNDIITAKIIPHIDVSIAIATAIQHHKQRMNSINCKAVTELLISHIVNESVDNPGVKSNLLKVLARSASERSSLPQFLRDNGKLRDPQGLPSYGCLNFNTSTCHNFSLNPTFGTDSPYVLLDVMLSHLAQDKSCSRETLKAFVDQPTVLRYINCATAVHKAASNYESQVQRSILSQFEIKLISKILLLLRRYYMMEEKDPGSAGFREPDETRLTRMESYSNLCYYTISILSLINSKIGTTIELKDQLLKEILLDYNLQARLADESYLSLRREEFLDIALRNIRIKDCKHSLSSSCLHILEPLYMSCQHPNRYWIFQPLIDYYHAHHEETEALAESSEGAPAKKSTGDWFECNIDWRHLTGELSSCGDEDIIAAILRFNFTMIAYSPAYAGLVVKPNLQEYLCLLGSLFSHDDIFLKEQVSQLLSLNLRAILNKCLEQGTGGRFNIPFREASYIIRSLNQPLWDFFEELVSQFEAVSYGDEGFANYLLLFITPRSDKAFRKKLFQEKADTCLRQIRVGPDGFFANPDIVSEEKEKDLEMRALIKRAKPHVIKGSFLYCYIEFHGNQ